MKKLFYRLVWIHWRFTGYRELTQLLRSHTGNYDALTPTGREVMRKLGNRESEIIRKMRGIQK